MAWRSIRARDLPDDGPGSGWYRCLPAPPPARRVTGDIRVDFAVVGAGICGCSVARRLGELRPDASIALVDASRLGHGTSGRNAGFLLDHHSHGGVDHLETARKNDRLSAAGTAWLRELVRDHQIRCQWSDWGRVYVAATPAGLDALAGVGSGFDALAVDWQSLGRDAVTELTGSGYYLAGIRTGGSALVQPAALMRGLGTSLPANVDLYEDSPVHEIDARGGYRLVCPDGVIAAGSVILCTHVATGRMGVASARVVPVATFASLTEPLSDHQAAMLGSGSEFGLLPAHPNGSTVRLTRDRRILMRNSLRYARTGRYSAALIEEMAAVHRRSIAARWPDLGDVAFTGTWGGVLGFTRNEGTVFGQFRDGLWALVSPDAAPMTRGAIGGKLLAELVCGHDSDLLRVMLSVPAAARIPPDPLLRLLVNRRLGRISRDGSREL